MGFKVNPQSMEQFAANLDLFKDAAKAAGQYTTSDLTIKDNPDGPFGSIKADVEHVVKGLQGSVERVGQLFGSSASEVRKVESLYRKTDSHHAKKLDSIYPKDGR